MKYILPLALSSLVLACNQSSPKQGAAPDTYLTEVLNLNLETQSGRINNKVDVLFVVDNSESMRPFQERLKANMIHFVDEFDKAHALDYHIGVTTIFDSVRYGTKVKEFMPNGTLIALKGPVEQGLSTTYYSANHKNSSVLAETLAVGVLPLKIGEREVGPEFEESFSPVIAALTEPMSSLPQQKGFFRGEASLVVIFVTDADDASQTLSVDDFWAQLKALKHDNNGESISIYGVLGQTDRCRSFFKHLYEQELTSGNKDTDHDEKLSSYLRRVEGNPIDPSGEPVKIRQLLRISGGTELPLCSEDYGGFLSQIGIDVRTRAFAQTIFLKGRPEKETLKVKVSGQLLLQGDTKAWVYDSNRNAVVIRDIATEKQITSLDPLLVEITYTKIRLDNLGSGYTYPTQY